MSTSSATESRRTACAVECTVNVGASIAAKSRVPVCARYAAKPRMTFSASSAAESRVTACVPRPMGRGYSPMGVNLGH